MSSSFTPLVHQNLKSGSTYIRPKQELPERVTASNRAIDVMTDFSKVAAIIMGPCGTLDAAEKRMIASEVRLLLVVDQSNQILGVITLTDLQGERPMQYLQETGGGKREDIFLRDIMTPCDKLEVLQMQHVNNSMVGDIIMTMRENRRQHALVVDIDADGNQRLRGLFSTKQISRQLGIDYNTTMDTTTIMSELSTFL